MSLDISRPLLTLCERLSVRAGPDVESDPLEPGGEVVDLL
jgi:hypothetical protein